MEPGAGAFVYSYRMESITYIPIYILHSNETRALGRYGEKIFKEDIV